MDLAELLKSSTIINIEMHVFFVQIILLLYDNMRRSYVRENKEPDRAMTVIYLTCALMIFFDCLWTSLSNYGLVVPVSAYTINLCYFFCGNIAAACWLVFCFNIVGIPFMRNNIRRSLILTPFFIASIVYLISPWTGLIFSIRDGEYVRGVLFFIDPLVKLGYISASSVVAFIYAKKEPQYYIRKKYYSLIFYGVPMFICGILQTLTGCDFNCLGCVVSLLVVYATGITNKDAEDSNIVYSLARSYDASYLVDMNTGVMRALNVDEMHDSHFLEMQSHDFHTRFNGILSKILVPDDREETLKNFNLEYITERFKSENSFTFRYRTFSKDGGVSIHAATFIHASGSDGKQEFLLGISELLPENMLYARNEALSLENQKLEDINRSIIQSVAKMVGVRDIESGEHIVRVQKYTKILAEDIMEHYTEYGLNMEAVELISSASVLHDIGKIAIPDAVLLKPGQLTDEEFAIMKTHTVSGCDMLAKLPIGLDDAFLGYANEICRWHHERFDGAGYPDGLKGDDIPISAQIVSVADCFDALTNERPYKELIPPDIACRMLMNDECGVFSPKLMEALDRVREQFSELAQRRA